MTAVVKLLLGRDVVWPVVVSLADIATCVAEGCLAASSRRWGCLAPNSSRLPWLPNDNKGGSLPDGPFAYCR